MNTTMTFFRVIEFRMSFVTRDDAVAMSLYLIGEVLDCSNQQQSTVLQCCHVLVAMASLAHVRAGHEFFFRVVMI